MWKWLFLSNKVIHNLPDIANSQLLILEAIWGRFKEINGLNFLFTFQRMGLTIFHILKCEGKEGFKIVLVPFPQFWVCLWVLMLPPLPYVSGVRRDLWVLCFMKQRRASWQYPVQSIDSPPSLVLFSAAWEWVWGWGCVLVAEECITWRT